VAPIDKLRAKLEKEGIRGLMIVQPSGMIAGTKAISPYKGACWNLRILIWVNAVGPNYSKGNIE
jgi:hypothetical protein